MKPKVILVTGGRKFNDRAYVERKLEECLPFFDDEFVIVQGDATGVDWHAKNWAISNGHPVISMNAAWDFYGNNAGNIRNGWMLKFTQADLLLAFPGGTGTADMCKQAKKAGVLVYAC